MPTLKVGVIGTGYLGSLHAKLYKEIPACSLAGVCDIDQTRAHHVASQLGVPAFTDYRRFFDAVDAVSVVVPTQLHFAVTRDCLKHGLHVLVEKPFTATLREADTLIRLARSAKRTLQVGHVERFNSAFAAAQQYFKNPFFIECHRLSSFPNRSLDVGVVLDLMIHDIDIVLGLVKSRIKKIEAVGVNVLTPYEDIANARITFASGCVANLTASRISDEVMRKIRIFLKNAYISLDYRNEQAYVYSRGPAGIQKESLPIEKEQPLKRELAAFVQCVLEKKPPVVTGAVAREALAVALTIRKLIWKNPKIF
ncbi:MAG TPA: Gfo/Idh/MocA family oxidoreductase [Candidatus Omnitrophota bacterium]|nr:Gfo/Idh/MocA family oxidoreductase [Candidatus Omnitrophota bacterium]HRZ15600.1 Gfo/Idh/MocA family oxidoreductase [Candidatus Omnitrophota bacterium]